MYIKLFVWKSYYTIIFFSYCAIISTGHVCCMSYYLILWANLPKEIMVFLISEFKKTSLYVMLNMN